MKETRLPRGATLWDLLFKTSWKVGLWWIWTMNESRSYGHVIERRIFLKQLTVGAVSTSGVAHGLDVFASPADAPQQPARPRFGAPIVRSAPSSWITHERFTMPAAGIRTDTRTATTANGDIYVGGGGFLWKSTNRGETWSQRPLPIRGGGGFGILNEDVFILVGYSSDHTINTVRRSTDYGATWSDPVRLDIRPYDMGGGGWSHVYQHPDGTAMLTVTLRSRAQSRLFHDHIFRSKDGGRSWRQRSMLIPYSAESTLLAVQGTGRMLAYVRAQRPLLDDDPPGFWRETEATENNPWPLKNGLLAESSDKGRTWNNARLFDTYGSVPGEVIQTPSGVIAALWLQRYPYDEAQLRVRTSSDDGRTWSQRTHLLSKCHGYPSSVVFADGTIVTACESTLFSTKGRPLGERSMAALRWRLPAADGDSTDQ